MSAIRSNPVWRSVEAALAQFHDCRTEFEQFVRGVGEEFTGLGDLLDSHAKRLAQHQDLVASDRHELDVQLDRHRQQSERQQEELERRQEAVAQAQQELESARGNWEHEKTAWESERQSGDDALSQRIDELQQTHNNVAAQLEDARRSLDEERARVEQLAADRKRAADEWQETETQLLAQQQALADQKQTLESENERLRREQADTEKSAVKYAELQRTLDEAGTAIAAKDAELAQIRQGLQENQDERTRQLERELAEARQQVGQVTVAEADLNDARDEIFRLRAELSQQHRGDSHPTEAEPQLQFRVQELERERETLETELESVRNRACELSQEAANGRLQIEQQRAQWEQELKRMRTTLETKSQGSNHARQEPQADNQQRAKTAAVDPVMDTLMAQFEGLKKDLAQRRNKKTDRRQGVA